MSNLPYSKRFRYWSSDPLEELANCKNEKCQELIKVYLPTFKQDVERSRSFYKQSMAHINDSDLMSAAGQTSRFSVRTA
jgi:hypothetical protein